MFKKCICGEEGKGFKLTGGYHVYLCLDCVNIWSSFIRELPIYEEYNLARAFLYRAIGNQVNDLQALNKREIELEGQLYEIAKAWVEERRKDLTLERNLEAIKK